LTAWKKRHLYVDDVSNLSVVRDVSVVHDMVSDVHDMVSDVSDVSDMSQGEKWADWQAAIDEMDPKSLRIANGIIFMQCPPKQKI
jgi:hypothetical protein